MTLSTIGGHFTKNGLGAGYPSRVCLSIQGNGLDEQHPDTIKVFRDVTVYNDGPPDLHTHPQRRTVEFATYWYGKLRPIWQANAHRADYFTITNELGGSNPDHILDHIAFESNICRLAYADGLKCAVGKLAGDSPGWDTNLWEELYAPFIIDMWDKYGAIYARHVYGGNLVDSNGFPTHDPPGNPQRPFFEAYHLRKSGYGGGMVLAECGIDGGYGVADYGRFRAQVLGYAEALKPHADMIIGLCFWECGETGFNADYTSHLKRLKPELDTSLPRWEGGQPDMTPKECDLYLDLGRFVHLLPQNTTADEIATIAQEFNSAKNSFVYSHDDAELIIAHGRGQNSEGKRVSEVKIWEPERFSEDVLGYFATRGYKYSVGYFEGDPVPPAGNFTFTHWSTPHRVVTQRFRNNPSYYAQFGLPGHEGVDIRAYHGDPVFAVADGAVSQIHDSATGSNYGRYIRIAHQDGYETTYAHCDRLVSFQVGQLVKAGSVIAYADNTGNSQGSHLHLTLKKKPSSYVDRCGTMWPYNIVDPEPYLKAFSNVQWISGEVACGGSPPPSGRQVNIRKYFEPTNEYGRKYVLRWPDGKTQPQQLRKLSDGTIALFKGDGQTIDGKFVYDYERFFFDAVGNLRRLEDTSAGGRNAYSQNGAVWLPPVITEGTTYTNVLTVTNYDRISCQKLSDNQTTDYLTFAKYYPTWTSPQNQNIVLQDVCKIEWRKSPGGKVEETYYLAEGIVYGGWDNAAIHEWADGQQNIKGKVWDCG